MTVSECQRAEGGAAEAELPEEDRWVFPLKRQSSGSEEVELGDNFCLFNGDELQTFLQSDKETVPTTSSEEGFYDSLKVLERKNRQCLLELGLLYQMKLKHNRRHSQEDKELKDFFKGNGRLTLPRESHAALSSGNLRRFSSLTDLSADGSKHEQNHNSLPQSFSRSKSASAAWISSVTIPQPFKMTLREAHKKSQLLKSHALLEIESTAYKKQCQEEAECQKQFKAQPVPAHIYLPLYQEIMEKNEVRRQVETQKRKELLLSMQKPFSFQEKEEKKKEAIRQSVLEMLAPAEKSMPRYRKKIPKSTYEQTFGDKLKEAELLRKIRIEMRAKDLLENSRSPIDFDNRQKESRIAYRNREQKLGFLQDNFSFKPRINTSVPDFERLYWEFQREGINKPVKEATRNKPFTLRTSNLRCKHQVPSQGTMDYQPQSRTPVHRSRSLNCLSSLSSNTLPVYITDAVRKRQSAIKLLQEDKKYKESETARWAELQKKKCRAMHKSVNYRAKAMDPHKSLEETYQEKLKQNRQNDQEKTREYKKELEEMKLRVKNRPYLFEQVTKDSACQGAQRLFRDTLKQYGLNEDFVKSKGSEVTDLVGKSQYDSQRVYKSQGDIDTIIIQELAQEGQRLLELK